MQSHETFIDSFRRGEQLMKQEQYEYAHELFSSCVRAAPDHLPFVEAMLANLRAKVKGVKKKPGGRADRQLRSAMEKKDWPAALRIGIDQLAINPWHVATLRAMATACAALHYNEVELAYLKEALDANPKDPDTSQHCAESLARMGQFDQAMACWHRIEQLKGESEETRRMISHLTDEKMRYPDGRPPETTAPSETAVPESEVKEEESEEPETVEPEMAREATALPTEPPASSIRHERKDHVTRKGEHKSPDDKATTKSEFVFPWLESLLVAAAAALYFQFRTDHWQACVDFVSDNARSAALLTNITILLILVWLNRKNLQNF